MARRTDPAPGEPEGPAALGELRFRIRQLEERNDGRRPDENDPGEKRALQAALRLLARRDHSEWELSRKLDQRGFDGRAVSTALRKCRHYGYLNDRRWGRLRAEGLQKRGYGVRWIRSELVNKGLSEEATEEIVDAVCTTESQAAAARRALSRRRAALERERDPFRRRVRIHRYLTGRGFRHEQIERAERQGVVD